ncbi:MAG: tetratricopeptide repeat protein [Prevotella sp.]
MTAQQWYERGNDFRKQSDWQHAINCYMEAIALDAHSPAVEAKEMLESILNFYNKDAYNP